MASLLEAKGVSVAYGGMVANKEIDLSVDAGRLVGLIGPNGAGKTTFLDALSGFTSLSAGSILFDSRDLTRVGAHRRSQHGLGRTFQAVELFDDLSVIENLLIGAEPFHWWTPLANLVAPRVSSAAEKAVHDSLAAVGLSDLAELRVDELSNGQQKLVGLARALAGRPRLLLLDEPAAGLDSGESLVLGQVLRRLVREEGIAILLVDHDMGLILEVCDEIYVLDFGSLIAHGEPDQVKSDPDVIAAYLGGAPTHG